MSEARTAAAFVGLGVVLVGVALGLTRLFPPRDPVSALPDVPEREVSPARPERKASAKGAPHLYRRPTLSKTQIAFELGGEIWIVAREGGVARRLVAGQEWNWLPSFSPDGTKVAFAGMYDHNTDVYVIDAEGGEPKRLTWHPERDEPIGWTADGTKILVRSFRDTVRDYPKLYTLPFKGGVPERLPLPSGYQASFSPDGSRLAYLPFWQYQPEWKKYRGGQETKIWIADLSDSHVGLVPHAEASDKCPVWVGTDVYFISDRDGTYSLYVSEGSGTAAPKKLVDAPVGDDIRWLSGGPDGLVYEQLGKLSVFDLAKKTSRVVPISIQDELPGVRPHFEKLGPKDALHVDLSPSGKRIVFEAHGEILTSPVEKGDTRNLTNSPAVADRSPAWSPDGKWIAWLSDESGEYSLHLRSPDGVGPVKNVDLGSPPSFFYRPVWSPDSKKIALTDKRLNLWLIDLDHPTPVKVDTQRYSGSGFDEDWSPDSKWLVYTRVLDNFRSVVTVYSLDEKKSHELTAGTSDAGSPRFARDGKTIWFTASTDEGLADTGTMWEFGRSQTSSVYAIVLRKGEKSPVAPESDEEGEDTGKGKHDGKPGVKETPKGADDAKEKATGKDKEKEKAAEVKIDLDDIDQRIVAAPIDRANWVDLQVGENGVLFLLKRKTGFADEDYLEYDDEHPVPRDIWRFDLKKRKAKEWVSGVGGARPSMAVSFDGKHVLYVKDDKWIVAPADEMVKDEKTLKAGDIEVWVDPREEWRQMWKETWRVERDFLYDPHFHGLDLAAAERDYAPFVPGLTSRTDLTTLVGAALSNLTLGHVRTEDAPGPPHQGSERVGLLGADFTISQGRYQFARILRGENWNPKMRAPLTEPGVDVKEGDYLLAVGGKELSSDDDVFRLFLGTADKQTTIRVGPKPTDNGARDVVVIPVRSDTSLRLRTWMEDNRKKVDQLSGGRVGYVYIPDTGGNGYTSFNRYFFAQAGKDGVVLDERNNHGGQIADYMVDIAAWTPFMGAATREGSDIVLPISSSIGTKVMLANEMSGSGGDALPWMFKQAKVGKVVGTRTWGGLVGVGGFPRLIDGATVTAPAWALYGVSGKWEVENHGVAPDVEVEQDPKLVRQGHDPQLERAVEIALDEIKTHPRVTLKRPDYVSYGERLPKEPLPLLPSSPAN